MNDGAPSGTLYGIGVGPGDPELMTLKAIKILQQIDYVFGAAAAQNEHSLALRIAKAHVRNDCVVESLPFAMSSDEEVTRSLWRDNAVRLADLLNQGKNVGFLTLGDPLIFSTYGYLLREIRHNHPSIPIVTVPGITSFQAVAARLGEPLVEGDESLLITSARRLIEEGHHSQLATENLVIMKPFRRMAETISWLEQRDLLSRCRGVKRCTLPDEAVYDNLHDLMTEAADYWTLLVCHAQRRSLP